MREITYADAVREAMSEEMRRDENVFFMGEDIGVYNGAFGVSKGMIQEFGEERVRETPISETGFVGAAVGAAMLGMRPIVELMFSDFMTVCWDQIANEAAKVRMMLGGAVKVPMVLRTASGGGTGAAAQHSQSLENLYCHIPGLKVVIPSTAYDAKGLLVSAIRDDNPVIFLEQKRLYREKGLVPEEEYTIPLGLCDIKKPGRDVTIVTYGRMVQMSLAVAEKLEADGISAEIIDIRTLVPLDTKTIIESVKKTRRVVIVHEAVQFSGFGAEIAAQIADSEAFFYLDAPIKRVGGLYTPIPFNPILEASVFPTPAKIESAVRDVISSAVALEKYIALPAAAFAGDEKEKRITLLARRIAKSKGIDISNITGSGVGGRIFSADLKDAPALQAAVPEKTPEITAELEEGDTVIKMNGMRRVIAKRMSQSSRETAVVSQFMDTDVTKLLNLRSQMNEGKDKSEKITLTAFFLRAMALAVKEHERFRMQMGADGNSFVLKKAINIGVAVGTPEGLTVPVLRDADTKSVSEINIETAELAQKARDGKLLPEDYKGGVITLTNMGMYGVTSFTPIINQPEASILGIGVPTEKLVKIDGEIASKSNVVLSLTYDHRIINGTESALFQQSIKELLENPDKLL